MPAQQLVTNDKGEVTGAICKNEEGKYVQYNASKGVVLATGDVSYNDEYINEFAPIANKVMTPKGVACAPTRATPATATTWPHGLVAPSRMARGPR